MLPIILVRLHRLDDENLSSLIAFNCVPLLFGFGGPSFPNVVALNVQLLLLLPHYFISLDSEHYSFIGNIFLHLLSSSEDDVQNQFRYTIFIYQWSENSNKGIVLLPRLWCSCYFPQQSISTSILIIVLLGDVNLSPFGNYCLLINPQIFLLPVTPECVSRVIESERPDGIIISFGGQTGLTCGLALSSPGSSSNVTLEQGDINLTEPSVLETWECRLIGTPASTIEITEDRQKFAEAMLSFGEQVAPAGAAHTVRVSVTTTDLRCSVASRLWKSDLIDWSV